MELTYLLNSGFLIRDEKTLLVFDDYDDPAGIMDAAYDKGEDITTPMGTAAILLPAVQKRLDTMSAEDAPKDWADLVLPQYKDKIVVRDSLSSSMRSTISSWRLYTSTRWLSATRRRG